MESSLLSFRLLRFIVLTTLIAVLSPGCNLIEDVIDDFKKKDPVASKIIGPTGGEIDFEGIILKVPKGAFTGDNEISVNVIDGSAEFGEYAASSLYEVSGLPESSSKPISLKLKYSGTLTGDPLIASGLMKYSTSLDSTLFSYHTNPATDSSGYLIFEITPYSHPVPSGQLKSNFLGNSMNFIAMNAYTLGLSSGGHFAISYPLSYDQLGIQMGEYLENAYDTCAKMGFSYKVGNSEYAWPARVMALTIAPNTGGYYSSWGSKTMEDKDLQGWVKDGDLTINTNILANEAQLRAVCGHEFLHLVQNIYEFSSGTIEPEQGWLMEAAAVWIEEKYSITPNYYSSAFNNREKYPFRGLQYAGSGYPENGYGLNVLIKDIAEVYGEDAVVNIHEKIRAGTLPDGAVDPVEAVLSVINEPIGNFWHGLLGSYLLGHYFNGQASTKLLDNIQLSEPGFMISHDIPSHTFTGKYHDLSGRLYWLSAGDLGSNKFPVSFIVDEPVNCGILVCKYKVGGEIVPIGEVYPGGTGQVIIDDVKRVFDDGYEIVVMVSNSTHDKTKNYQGTNEVNLSIGKVSGMTSGKVEFFLDQAVFKRTDESSPYTSDLSEVLHLRNLTGTMSNNSYSGTYSYTSLGRKFSGFVSMDFIDNPQQMNIRINHKMSYQGNFGFGERKFEYTMRCYDIPYESYDATSGMFIYSETGSTVSKMNITWTEKNDLYTNVLKSHNCGASSFIRVAVDSR